MFNPFAPKDAELSKAITSVYSDLAGFTAETEEFQKSVDNLTKLYALAPKPLVDPNEVIKIAGSLAIARSVLKFEETGVITTKLFQFFGKMR